MHQSCRLIPYAPQHSRKCTTVLIKLLIIAALLTPIKSEPIKGADFGYAPYYNPGVMARVAKNRKLPLRECMVASPKLKINSIVSVYGANTGNTLTCYVYDVSAPRDKARHLRKRYAVELDFRSAGIICGKGFHRKAPKQCPVYVTVLHRA